MNKIQQCIERCTKGSVGSYLLFLKLTEAITINIRGKELGLDAGYYIYAGSAFGTGGLASRLKRHLRKQKKVFWHIDRLTSSPYCYIEGIAVSINRKAECELSQSLNKLPETTPVFGFGNSDCKQHCPAHLYKLEV